MRLYPSLVKCRRPRRGRVRAVVQISHCQSHVLPPDSCPSVRLPRSAGKAAPFTAQQVGATCPTTHSPARACWPGKPVWINCLEQFPTREVYLTIMLASLVLVVLALVAVTAQPPCDDGWTYFPDVDNIGEATGGGGGLQHAVWQPLAASTGNSSQHGGSGGFLLPASNPSESATAGVANPLAPLTLNASSHPPLPPPPCRPGGPGGRRACALIPSSFSHLQRISRPPRWSTGPPMIASPAPASASSR
jgi:hypothetical protein